MDLEDLQTFVEVATQVALISRPASWRLEVHRQPDGCPGSKQTSGIQLLARTLGGRADRAASRFRDHAARVAPRSISRGDDPPAATSGRLPDPSATVLARGFSNPVCGTDRGRYPLLHVHNHATVTLRRHIRRRFDCAIRGRLLSDSNLIARRIGPIHGKLSQPGLYQNHGAPETPEELVSHQALCKTEAWQIHDGDRTIASSAGALQG